MISGAHVVIHSKNAEEDRAFLRDVLGFKSVDAGRGWLIFALPPAEAAFHPSDENGPHELYFMCDDLEAEMASLAKKNVGCSKVQEARWGSITKIRLPGGGEVGLYQPKHPTAFGAEAGRHCQPTSPDTMIRPATRTDDDAIWDIFHAVVSSGDTYTFDPDTPREEALGYWFRAGTHAYVAESDGRVVGTYILKANQPGLGSHVANAAFMVSPASRGKGVGKLMGTHCLCEARKLGFRAMQFNFVVSTNRGAVRLWQQLGFRIVGTLPGAFRHARDGFVDAFVMFQELDGTAQSTQR